MRCHKCTTLPATTLPVESHDGKDILRRRKEDPYKKEFSARTKFHYILKFAIQCFLSLLPVSVRSCRTHKNSYTFFCRASSCVQCRLSKRNASNSIKGQRYRTNFHLLCFLVPPPPHTSSVRKCNLVARSIQPPLISKC